MTANTDRVARFDLSTRITVGAVYSSALLLCAAGALARIRGWSSAPAPYAWWDVAAVCFVCAIPVGVWLAILVGATWRPRILAITGIALLLTCAGTTHFPEAVPAAMMRIAPPVLFTTGMALVMRAMFRRTAADGIPGMSPGGAAFTGALAAGILVGVPMFYIEARCSNDADLLQSRLDQSRLDDALQLASGMLLLKPDQNFEGHSLQRVRAALEHQVRELEQQVAVPLDDTAADSRRVERARDLAMLGREQEALDVLEGIETSEACILRGAIHETREEWELALRWYERGRQTAVEQPGSAEPATDLATALRGIAFCHRRMGQNIEAEAAYLRLLSVAPTAETHFLLAQFYEDTQKSDAARRHARAAMALAPGRYDAAGERLIDGLMTTHFGCAGVFLSERDERTGARVTVSFDF